METDCVLCELQTEFSYKIQLKNVTLNRVKGGGKKYLKEGDTQHFKASDKQYFKRGDKQYLTWINSILNVINST
jgi:hypothetical protein